MFMSILTNFSSLFNNCFFELHHANTSSQSPATRVKNPSKNTELAITKYRVLTEYLVQRFILVQFLSEISIKRHFNKEIKFISFEASKKHVRVHSILLLYLSSHFLKKVLYDVEQILSTYVTQEIMQKRL